MTVLISYMSLPVIGYQFYFFFYKVIYLYFCYGAHHVP